jgi:predicted dehydrogenase
MALTRPARKVGGVSVEAVAARDPDRARSFARKHRIPSVHKSYQDLLDDPEIDAVYNPLPNSLHCEWTVRALEAGKHVLCEKPMASNADEARRMADAAEKSGRVLMEAFHWRYHPLAQRLREVVESGVLGEIRHIAVSLCVPMIIPGNIRYRYELGGGALMDVGAYAVNILRFLAQSEPTVHHARAKLSSPQVDRWMTADFDFDDGRSGRITCSLFSARLLSMSARVTGELGELRVLNPIAPHIYHRLKIVTAERSTVEHVSGESTYVHQLRAFAAAVAGDTPLKFNALDSVANMAVIDSVYLAAGLARRGESAPP